MAYNRGELTKVLLIGVDGYPYVIGGDTDTTGTFDLSECRKVIVCDEAGEPYQI